jgi:hypothetical protein
MRFLCEAYTDGGPVAILQQEHLSLWDGDEDYFRAVNQPRSGCLQFMLDFKGRSSVCLFHQESDGNFHVYHDRATFLVLSEIAADAGYEIRNRLPAIAPAMTGKPPVRLTAFGGKVVVFNAAIPGGAIRLREVGCEQVYFSHESLSHRYDAALIEVDTGNWHAFELYWKDDHLSFDGVLFQLTR